MSEPNPPKGGTPSNGGAKPSSRHQRGKFAVKVYIVLAHHSLPRRGKPSVTLLCACLTRAAAQRITNLIPGTEIVKFVAEKVDDRSDREILDALAPLLRDAPYPHV